jgi:hypothetical protein
MLREPRSTEKALVPSNAPKKSRFRFVKLEERIAPCQHTNPQGKKVGSDNHCGGGL